MGLSAPRTFRQTPLRRAGNAAVALAIRAGLTPRSVCLLGVRGRRSGTMRWTPVQLVQDGGGRYLVAPYGAVQWVRNARAAGEATVRHGRRREQVRLEELDAAEAAPVLRGYVRRVAVVRPYFDAGKDAPVEAFAAEAAGHPVFRLT